MSPSGEWIAFFDHDEIGNFSVAHTLGLVTIHDTARDGRVLLASSNSRISVQYLPPRQAAAERRNFFSPLRGWGYQRCRLCLVNDDLLAQAALGVGQNFIGGIRILPDRGISQVSLARSVHRAEPFVSASQPVVQRWQIA